MKFIKENLVAQKGLKDILDYNFNKDKYNDTILVQKEILPGKIYIRLKIYRRILQSKPLNNYMSGRY